MKGPERVTLPLMGFIIMYILKISAPILKWHLMLLIHILTRM